MKSVPFTSRGPVDDDNFPWVASQPRVYQSQGDLGFRGLHHELPHSSTRHRRSRTTGSMASSSAFEDRDRMVLPKIATGRSAKSAKKLWQDYENIKIKAHIQNELETPRIPPLYVPKNPKPLYKRPVDEWKEFDTLHFRDFAEKGEIEPDDLTDCKEFYSQITFLRNAVRNIDGTTSYQNLCKKPRGWSKPSVVDDQPGLIAGNRLHWQSASKSLPHPRMLLPLQPGPNTKWYAWRVAAPNSKDEKQRTKRKDRNDLHGAFIETFSPRVVPHPTPAVFKAQEDTPKPDNSTFNAVPYGGQLLDPAEESKASEDSAKAVEPKGITFITESKDENVEERDRDDVDNAPVAQGSAEDSAAPEQANNEAGGRERIASEQTVGAQEDGEARETKKDDSQAESGVQEDADGGKQSEKAENGDGVSSLAEEQGGGENDDDQIPATEQVDGNAQGGEIAAEGNDGDVNKGDDDVPKSSGPEEGPSSEDDNMAAEEAPLPSNHHDANEDTEYVTDDLTHEEGMSEHKNNDQKISNQEGSPGAVDQADQHQSTELELAQEVAEEAQAPTAED